MSDPLAAWERGVASPRPAEDEIHVWIAPLAGHGVVETIDLSALSTAEVQRAQAAHSETFRHRFTRSRAVLRRLLSRYLAVAPSKIPLELNEHGRPSLGGHLRGTMDFNLSHTDEWGLFAFAWGRRVGIDLERLDRKADWRRIAMSTFSALERHALEGANDSGGTERFLRAWLRKEAYSKGRGAGFAYGFSHFSVSVETPLLEAGLLEDHHDPDAIHTWWIRDLEIALPLAAALAGEGKCETIRRWRYSP